MAGSTALDDLLKAAGKTEAQIDPGLGALLSGEQPTAQQAPVPEPQAQNAPVAAEPEGGQTAANSAQPALEALLAGKGGPQEGLGANFASGAYRGVKQMQAIPSSLQAIYREKTGDQAGAVEAAKAAKATLDEGGESEWSLSAVKDPTTFSYWMAEKLGEMAPVTLAALATGGTGAIATGLAARQLVEAGLIRAGTAQAMQVAGVGAANYAFGAPMAAAGTSQELFNVTGSPEADISLKAGAVNGALMSLVPMAIAKTIMAGTGTTLAGSIAKLGVENAGAMAAQEAVSIYSRQMVDPSYTYFGTGPTPWYAGEGISRMAESAATGGLVGAAYGAPFAHGAAPNAPKGENFPEGEKPGATKTIPAEPGLQRPQEALAPDKVKIEKDQPGSRQWVASSDYGEIFASVDHKKKVVQIESSGLEKASEQGQGHGMALYKALADEALAAGYRLQSDSVVSEKAQRAYEGLQRRGYMVTQRQDQHVTQSGDQAGPYKYDRLGRPIFQVMAGPVTQMRELMVPGEKTGIKRPQEALAKTPKDDVLQLTPLVNATAARMEGGREQLLDTVERLTKRYVRLLPFSGSIPNNTAERVKFDHHMMTDTDLERYNAGFEPQARKPRVLEVDQSNLQPGAITAHLTDLAPPNSERVVFPFEADPAKRADLLKRYAAFYKLVDGAVKDYSLAKAGDLAALEEHGKPAYDQLLTEGLRVIPSHGSSFYYNGVISGREVEPPSTTGRSEAIALYDPVTRKVTKFTPDLLKPYGDWEPDKQMVVSLDMNKLQAGDFKLEKDGSITLLKQPDVQKMVPGVSLHNAGDNLDLIGPKVGFFNKGNKTQVLFHPSEVLPENLGLAQEISNALQKLAPVVDKVMDALGLDQRVALYITDKNVPPNSSHSPAWVRLDLGAIGFSPDTVKNHFDSGLPLEQRVLGYVMHELGHQITYNYYTKLPVEVKDQIDYAYQKALLANRLNPMLSDHAGSTRADALVSPDSTQRNYYLTFPEYLAEQFRRHATSNPEISSWIDSAFKQGARQLERYYDAFERATTKLQRLDLQYPDYYMSAAFEYLRDYGDEKKNTIQLMRQQSLYNISQDVLNSPAAMTVVTQFRAALNSMVHMFPEGVRVEISDNLNAHLVPGMDLKAGPDVAARWIHDPSRNLKLMEFAMAAMRDSDQEGSRVYISHELMHSYEDFGLITKQETDILDRDITASGRSLGQSYHAQLKAKVAEWGKSQGWSDTQIQVQYEQALAREYRAHYISDFANTGLAHSTESRTIMQRFLEVIDRIRNYMQGLGYQSRDDVLRAFFKGEMAGREDRAAAHARDFEAANRSMEAIDQGRKEHLRPTSIKEVEPGVHMVLEDLNTIKLYHFLEGPSGRAVSDVSKLGKIIGHVQVEDRGPKGWEVDDLASARPGFMGRIAMHVAKDMGLSLHESLKPPREASGEGKMLYAWVARDSKFKGVFDYYVKDPTPKRMESGSDLEKERWYSPNHVLEQYNFWQMKAARDRASGKLNPDVTANIEANLAKWKELRKQVPEKAWSDPRLLDMFSLKRNYERDDVQGSLIRAGARAEESKLLESMGQGQAQLDAFSAAFQQHQDLSQAENARRDGLPFATSAPSSMLTYESRKIWEWATGYGNNPRVDSALINTQLHETDRIGKFTKWYWTIKQLIMRNEHIPGLQDYGQHNDLMLNVASQWLNRADNTARTWRDVSDPGRRAAISETLFDLTEMNYLGAAERAAKTVRLPMNWVDFLAGKDPVAGSELDRLFKKNKLAKADHDIIRKVQNDFLDFLKDVEDVRKELLDRTYASRTSPQYLKAVSDLRTEMAELRQKPYFPMMRFGEFTITVRDHNDNNKIVYTSAYENHIQRDAAVREVQRNHPGMDLTIGRVPENSMEFMSLPGPMLRLIKEKMQHDTGQKLTPEQLSWMEQFEHLNSPDRTFKKRWMPTKATPGYSMDAFRAYAHYFQNGSRYLSRLKYMDLLQQDIAKVHTTVLQGNIGNTAKRQAIVKYMQDHYHYMMEGGRDSGKFRSFFTLFYLGFSPAAAFTNLTQPIMTTFPTLAGHFGYRKGYAGISAALSSVKATRGYATGSPQFLRARDEMVRQGAIDVGQAPQLAAFAEGYNLNHLLAGSGAAKLWQGMSYWGMSMFGAVEHFNREWTMKAAWDLAIDPAHANVKRLKEIDQRFPVEISDLVTRLGMSRPEAVAFLFSKEMINQTQFQFNKSSDPPFMRGKLRKDLLIFFKYTQAMTYALRFNGNMTGMLLTFAFLYGLKGLPGSEDINEVLRLVAKKLFGKDFDLHEKARSFVRDATRGTAFDQTGPDLALHGISHFGFGLGLLPSGYGAPQFDASANGSLGRVVPGLADAAHGLAVGADGNKMIADASQRASGAGYGTIFALLHYLQEKPGTEDSKKWEQLLPRSLHALAKAYRYTPPEVGLPQIGGLRSVGAETTQSGARIPGTQFNASDPEDLTTVAMQALGFTPTRVSEAHELRNESQEAIQLAQSRKLMLYAQMDKAIQSKDPQAVRDVTDAVRKYNDDVKQDDPILQINANQLRAAIQQRIKARAMTEQQGAANKIGIAVTRRTQDLYPGTRTQPVK